MDTPFCSLSIAFCLRLSSSVNNFTLIFNFLKTIKRPIVTIFGLKHLKYKGYLNCVYDLTTGPKNDKFQKSPSLLQGMWQKKI